MEVVREMTGGWGADIAFEASGSEVAAAGLCDFLCPGGRAIYIGCPAEPFAFDLFKAMIKEARIETIFRYAHMYPRALALMGSGRIDVKPLITDTYAFAEAVAAFDYALRPRPETVKIQIRMPEGT